MRSVADAERTDVPQFLDLLPEKEPLLDEYFLKRRLKADPLAFPEHFLALFALRFGDHFPLKRELDNRILFVHGSPVPSLFLL